MATTENTRTRLVRRPYGRSSKKAGHETRRAGSFGAQLKAFREPAGFTHEEVATIARCLKPSSRTRRLSSPRRASATTPWRVSYSIAAVKPSSQRKGLVGPSRSRGWIGYARTWRATAARSRGHLAHKETSSVHALDLTARWSWPTAPAIAKCSRTPSMPLGTITTIWERSVWP